MDQLHSEILLPIFKNLSSIDIVPVRAVCRKFLEIIDSNKSLWRTLVLPDSKSKEGGCDSKVLVLWDDKSSSSLEEVSMHVKLEKHERMRPFIKTLERSKETLRILSIAASLPSMNRSPFEPSARDFSEVLSSLAQLALVLPKVVDFRVMVPGSIHFVRLIEKNQEKKNAGLRVLWLKVGFEAGRKVLFKMMQSQLLSTLVSLKLEFGFRKPSELRAVLKGSSQTLKHVHIDFPMESEDLQALEFPLLECLEVHQSSTLFFIRLSFPSWMRFPSSTIVICEGITQLPSISRLWLKGPNFPSDLGFRAPRLQTLRIGSQGSSLFNRVLSLLDQRRKNVEELLEVDGVRMITLKRLEIWFDDFNSEQIDEMRGLVEEVIDLKGVSMVVEIEI